MSKLNRQKTLELIKEYFDIEELACNHLLEYYKDNVERCWDFLDTGFLADLLVIRRGLNKPMYCNNHSVGVHQRGLRCNLCELVKGKDRPYLSGHVLGKAGDFTIEGMTAAEARKQIKLMADKLPVPLRMEADVSWLHIDVMPTPNGNKVYEFKA